MKIFSSIMVIVLLSLITVSIAKDGDKLQNDIIKVRARIAEAQEKANAENWRYIRAKDRVVYSNDVVKVIYLDMKEAEKVFNEKRQKLEEEVMKLPEIREILKTRSEAFTEVRKLKDEEMLILKEIKTEESGVVKEDEPKKKKK